MKKMMLLILTTFFCSNLMIIAPPLNEDVMIKYNKYLEQKREEERKVEFNRYLETFGYYESGNNPRIVNTLGYCGKYQFGYSARKNTGFGGITLSKFKQNPDIWPEYQQDSAMILLLKINEKLLKKEIMLSQQTVIMINDTIRITKAGILAAAHLAGCNGVRKFFKTEGKYNPADLYGTKLSDYLIKFSKFNI